MKTAALLFMALNVTWVGAASADEFCGRGRWDTNLRQCVTVGTGLGVGTASGIYAAKNYSKGNSIEEKFTEKTWLAERDKSHPTSATSKLRDGDKVTVWYQLSERENRIYHIDLMQENASAKRSSAAMHTTMALTAMKASYRIETATNAQGQLTSTQVFKGMEPDDVMRAMHAANAINDAAAAREYEMKAQAARNGGPVPVYDLEKVIHGETRTAVDSAEFIKERLAAEGRITQVLRLPLEKFILVKSAINRARGGLAGAAIGLGFAAEEAVSGMVADKMQSSGFLPNIETHSRYESNY